jgi:hypothetical protein
VISRCENHIAIATVASLHAVDDSGGTALMAK